MKWINAMNTTDAEDNRLDMIQESGYCAFCEGITPDDCEEYTAADAAGKLVWMEGYNAARQHRADEE
mgnify:CR=1 FL=1